MTSQVIQVETVAAVPGLVGDTQHSGESRVLRKADGPLVQGTICMFGNHEHVGGENAKSKTTAGCNFSLTGIAYQSRLGLWQCASGLSLPAMLDRQIHIFVASVHNYAVAQGDRITRRKRYRDTGHKGHLKEKQQTPEQ